MRPSLAVSPGVRLAHLTLPDHALTTGGHRPNQAQQIPLVFPSYAARVSQVQAWSGICGGWVWPGRMAENRAVRNSRRSLASMSAVLGSVLVVYHGHSMRRLATSAGS